MVAYISLIQMKEAKKAHKQTAYEKPTIRASVYVAAEAEARAIMALSVVKPILARPLAIPQDPRTLMSLQGGNCYLCIRPLGHPGANHRESATRDHVFPQKAGAKAKQNILMAHGKCNVRKGGRWPYPCEVIYLASIYAR